VIGLHFNTTLLVNLRVKEGTTLRGSLKYSVYYDVFILILIFCLFSLLWFGCGLCGVEVLITLLLDGNYNIFLSDMKRKGVRVAHLRVDHQCSSCSCSVSSRASISIVSSHQHLTMMQVCIFSGIFFPAYSINVVEDAGCNVFLQATNNLCTSI